MAKKLIKKPQNTPKGSSVSSATNTQVDQPQATGAVVAHGFMTRVFNGQYMRVVKDDVGEPWIVANDICEILEYKNTSDAVKQHCTSETRKHQMETEGGMQWMLLISEADAYRLILGSRMPQAVEFQDWIVTDVLPSIRKTGKYKVVRKIDYTPASPESDSNAVAEAGEQLDLFPTYISFSLGDAAHQLRVARAKLAEQGTLFETPKAFLGYVIEKGLEAL